jgi:hypothetical protein
MSNNYGQIVFGAGSAFMTPYAANGPAHPTPISLPILQELSIDITADLAELYGRDQYAYGLAVTKRKIECKAKAGAIYAGMLSDLMFGATLSVGQTLGVLDETQTVTSHTATVAHAANFVEDLGVRNGTTGKPGDSAGPPARTQASTSGNLHFQRRPTRWAGRPLFSIHR